MVNYLIENGYTDLNIPPAQTELLPSIRDWYTKLDIYKSRINYATTQVATYTTSVNDLTSEYNTLEISLESITKQKSQLNKDFNSKYFRYIKEGSWIDESYDDPDLYYLDGLEVLYKSAFPRVE